MIDMAEENKQDEIVLPVASSLALLYLKEAFEKGKIIEIPSFGIKIEPEKKRK